MFIADMAIMASTVLIYISFTSHCAGPVKIHVNVYAAKFKIK